jgi:hypothetical protein
MIKEIDAEMSQCPIPINLSSSLVPFVLLLPLYGLPRAGQCLFHLPTNAVTSAISFSEKSASCKFITVVTAYKLKVCLMRQ